MTVTKEGASHPDLGHMSSHGAGMQSALKQYHPMSGEELFQKKVKVQLPEEGQMGTGQRSPKQQPQNILTTGNSQQRKEMSGSGNQDIYGKKD